VKAKSLVSIIEEVRQHYEAVVSIQAQNAKRFLHDCGQQDITIPAPCTDPGTWADVSRNLERAITQLENHRDDSPAHLRDCLQEGPNIFCEFSPTGAVGEADFREQFVALWLEKVGGVQAYLQQILTDAAPPISDRQSDILEFLVKRKAFDMDHRMTTEDIAEGVCGKGRGNSDSFKRPITQLKRRGLLETKGGSGGGCWLTEAGQAYIKQARHL
jgi:hypothetical protein